MRMKINLICVLFILALGVILSGCGKGDRLPPKPKAGAINSSAHAEKDSSLNRDNKESENKTETQEGENKEEDNNSKKMEESSNEESSNQVAPDKVAPKEDSNPDKITWGLNYKETLSIVEKHIKVQHSTGEGQKAMIATTVGFITLVDSKKALESQQRNNKVISFCNVVINFDGKSRYENRKLIEELQDKCKEKTQNKS